MLLRTPSRSGGTAARVEAAATVADEDLDRRRPAHLGVDVDPGGAGVLGRVDHRLAGRQHQRPQLARSTGDVADGDHLDRDAVGVLDLGRGRRRRARPAAVPRPVAGSPYIHARRSRSWARASRATCAAGRRRSSGSAPASAAPSRAGARPRRPAPAADPGGALLGRGRAASRNSHGPSMSARPSDAEDAGDDHVAGDTDDLPALGGEDQQRDDEQPDAGREPRVRRRAAVADQDPREVDAARCCRSSARAAPRRPGATAP